MDAEREGPRVDERNGAGMQKWGQRVRGFGSHAACAQCNVGSALIRIAAAARRRAEASRSHEASRASEDATAPLDVDCWLTAAVQREAPHHSPASM